MVEILRSRLCLTATESALLRLMAPILAVVMWQLGLFLSHK